MNGPSGSSATKCLVVPGEEFEKGGQCWCDSEDVHTGVRSGERLTAQHHHIILGCAYVRVCAGGGGGHPYTRETHMISECLVHPESPRWSANTAANIWYSEVAVSLVPVAATE